jgi:hypothetical protein
MKTMEMTTMSKTTADGAGTNEPSKIERFREEQAANNKKQAAEREKQARGGVRIDEPETDDNAQPKGSDANEDQSTGVLHKV